MATAPVIIGKNAQKVGVPPAIGLINPKYSANVAKIIRLASCYGFTQVWQAGNRVQIAPGERLLREERMKGYQDVDWIQHDYFFDQFERGVTPVAIELVESAEPLTYFEHPENALYVFGPEDGSIPQTTRRHCHRFVFIPTKHCLNLATAVATVLWDRSLKRQLAGLEDVPMTTTESLDEDRRFIG